MASKRIAYFHPRKGLVLVKRGFSWPAFFFGALWAAAKRMWVPVFFALSVPDFGIWFIVGYAQARRAGDLLLVGLLLSLAYAWARGHFGNRWLEASLRRRGYKETALELEPEPVFREPTF
jgi:hypothetical protein